MPAARTTSPGGVCWGRPQRLQLTISQTLGVGLVTVAWFGVSGEPELNDQFRWVALATVGAVVAGFGNVLWLLGGRQAVTSRYVRAIPAPPARSEESRPAPEAHVTSDPVSAVGMRLYHRPGCLLTRQKSVVPARATEHRTAGRQPCKVCQP